MKKISSPKGNEYAMYYEQYLKLVAQDSSVLNQLKASAKEVKTLYKSLDPAALITPYQPGKWSLKDVLMHLIDVERVFVYRAMRFARLDKTPLPFFDENEFALQAQADKIPLPKLLKEYNANRTLTIAFFNNLSNKQTERMGIASQFTMSVRACAWIIMGHELHHRKVIRERYLKSV